MNSLSLLIQIVVLVIAVIALTTYFSRQRAAHRTWRAFLTVAQPVRQLSATEKAAIHKAFKRVRLASDAVYVIQGPAATHGLSTSHRNDIRLLIGGMEILLFPQWALYVREINRVEVVAAKRRGAAVPVVFNGVSLADALERKAEHKGVRYTVSTEFDGGDATTTVTRQSPGTDAVADAIVRGERKETPQEAVLRKSDPANNSGMVLLAGIGLGGLLYAASLAEPWQWAAVLPGVVLAYAGWKLLREWRAPRPGRPITLRTLSGALGLMRTSTANDRDPQLSTQLCIGQTPLHYPPGWKVVLLANPQGEHRVEVTDKNRVVRHDGLSLYEQRERIPILRWGRYLTLVIIAVPLLAASFWVAHPVGPTLQAAINRVRGHSRVLTASSPGALREMHPQPGDELKLDGVAQCFGGSESADRQALHDIMRGDSVACARLGVLDGAGTTANALSRVITATRSDWHIPEPIVTLTALASQLDSASSAPGPNLAAPPASDIARMFQRLVNRTLGVNVNELVSNVDAACQVTSTECGVLEAHIVDLTRSNDWASLLTKAHAGALPTRSQLTPDQSASLSSDIITAVAPLAQNEQIKLLAQWRTRHRAGLYLEMRGSPAKLHSALPQELSKALGQRSVKSAVVLPVLQLGAMPFGVSGEMLSVNDTGDRRTMMLRTFSGSVTPLAAIAPAAIVLVSVLMLVIGFLGLVRNLPRRKAARQATQEYVLSRLKI